MRKKLLSVLALLLTMVTGTWAQTYTVSLNDGAQDAANWTITPNTGVSQGTNVNINYNGSLKVSSITAIGTCITNELINSTFTSGLDGWGYWNVTCEHDATGGIGGGGAAKITNTTAGNVYDAGIAKDLASALKPGNTYMLSFKIRSNVAGHVMYSVQQPSGDYHSVVAETKDVGTSWVTFEKVFTVPADDTHSYTRVALTMGADANVTYWVDDVVFGEVTQQNVALTNVTAGKQWTMSMPYGDVELQVEYCPVITANSDGAATPSFWATYYNSTTSYTADENTTVFQAALSATQLTLTPVPNREIPAGKAVILKSSSATIALTPASTTETLEGNELQGTATSITNPGNAYVLNKTATNGVGFYKLSSTGTIGANKAYLTYSGASQARSFFGFDETTGIEMPTAEVIDADGVVYDLQGRRVAQPTKGLYIVNGKKVIIK